MKDYFYTESLNVVAWLISKGFEIKSQTKLDRNTVFYFDRSEKLNNAINQYNNNIELKKFISAFREVKKCIHNK